MKRDDLLGENHGNVKHMFQPDSLHKSSVLISEHWLLLLIKTLWIILVFMNFTKLTLTRLLY